MYTLADGGPPDLVGTFEGCTVCDPDLLGPDVDSPPPGGANVDREGVTMAKTDPRPEPDPQPNPEPEPDEPQPGF